MGHLSWLLDLCFTGGVWEGRTIWSSLSSLGEVLRIDCTFSDIKSRNSHSNSVTHDGDPPSLNLTCSTSGIGSPWRGAWLEYGLCPWRRHKTGGLGRDQDLVFGFVAQRSTLLTNKLTTDSWDGQFKAVSAALGKATAKGTAILYQFHFIKNSIKALWGWESGVSSVRCGIEIWNCSRSKA